MEENSDFMKMDSVLYFAFIELKKRFGENKTPLVFSHIDINKESDVLAVAMARNYCSLVQRPFYVKMNLFSYLKFSFKYHLHIKRTSWKVKQPIVWEVDGLEFLDKPLRAAGVETIYIHQILQSYFINSR